MTDNLATRLFNAAVWHSEMADKTPHPKDRERHEEISNRFFIRAYWLRRAA